MEEQVVLTKTSFEMMKRVFRGKRMKIHELEKDNEELRKAFEITVTHHAKSKRSKDLIGDVESASSSPSLQEGPQRCSQETVGQGNSAPSIQNRIEVSYKRTQCSYLTSDPPLVSSGYPAANAAYVNVPNSSLNTPAPQPFNEVLNPPSQDSQQLPRFQVQQPNPGVLPVYPAFPEMRNKPPPPYQNFHKASVSFQSNQTLSYQSSVPVNSHQSPVPVNNHQSSVPVNSHLSSVPVNSHQSSVPVNNHQSSVPVNNHHSSVPVNSHLSSVSVNYHQSSVPVNSVNSHQSSVPVNSYQSLGPVNSHQVSVAANSYQPSVPLNSNQSSAPVNSHQSSAPVNSHQSSAPVNSHQSSAPVNSHQSSAPVNSHQVSVAVNSHQSSEAVNSHQSEVPVNQTQAYSQVQHQTFHAQLMSHHQPQPCLPVPNQSHFRNLHHNQPQNCPQTTRQGLLPEGFMQPQHQAYRTSQLPYPGIQNASPNQTQKHQPPNLAIPRQRLYVRHDLHSDQSFTNSTSQNQSSFGRIPDVLHGTVTNHGYQLSGEQNLQYTSTASRGGCFRPLWHAASKEASSPNGSFSPENNNFSNVLSHDKNEEDTCCIIYESKIVGTNKPHGQSPCTRLQNSSNTYPNTLSGNSCQTDNHGQATITSEPFTCPGPVTVNTKTDSLPPVITPPLTPPTPNSSKPVQLNSDAQCNVTCSLVPKLAPAQNLFTPQPVPLSTGDQPPLNNNSSEASDQRIKPDTVDMPDRSRDSPSISLGPCDSESRQLPVPLPDIDADSIFQRINNSPKNSDPSISSKEFGLSQSSSFIAESANGETTQVSLTTAAVTDTSAKMTLVKDKISNGSSVSCGDTQGIGHKEKLDRHPAIPSVNNNAVVTVTSIPSVPLMSTGSTAHFNDPESSTTKQGNSSPVKSLSEGSKFNFPRVKTNALSKNHEKGYLVSEIGKACIPKSLTTYCYVCRGKDIKGKDVLQHLIFGNLKCKLCNLSIESCLELRDIDKKQSQCKVAHDEAHVFSVWYPNPVDFLSFQIWQFSHDRAKGVPSSEKTAIQMHNYLKMLRPLCNVKPWSSALRMCRRYSDASLKSNLVRSGKSDLKTNNDLLSRLVMECEISTGEELNRATVSSSSEGNLKHGDMKENSTGSVKTKSSAISTSDKGEICGRSVDSEVDSVSSTSVVRESSTSLVNSKPSSASPLVVGEAPKGLVIPESCTTSSSIAREGSKEKVKSEAYSKNTTFDIMTESCKVSVPADEGTFAKEEVKIPTSLKGEQIVEEETNDDEFAVESSDGEFKSADIIKAPFPEMKETEGSCATMNNEYLLESSCSFEYLDKVIEYVNLLDDVSRSESKDHNSKTLSEDLLLDRIDKHIDSQGQNSKCIDSRDKNRDFQGQNDTRVDSRTKCDRSSDSQNLNVGGVNSRDIDSQEVTKNEKDKQSKGPSDFQVAATLNDTSEGGSSPSGLPTLNDLPPPQEASNLHCLENYLIINLQEDRKTVKCPEECPMCYTVLCPSRFSVNLKTFHLTSRCIGCGLLIVLKFDKCNGPSKSKRPLKRPGPKSKTGTGSAKKPKPTN